MPPNGALADFGARWLGWDVAKGGPAQSFDMPELHSITMTPRKYGFHGTLKPPFRLAEGQGVEGLQNALSQLACALAPARSGGLELTRLGGFLSLTPTGDTSDLARVATACVRDLDIFRAPATEAELERRRKAGLSASQDDLLMAWGYPYVMEEFRFHLTLSGRLPDDQITHWAQAAAQHLPDLPETFEIAQIALCGERADGCFELIHRYTLSG